MHDLSTQSNAMLERCRIVSHTALRKGFGLLTLEAPKISQKIQPGQFVHLKLGDNNTRFSLRRPLSVYNYDAHWATLEIFYQVKGAGTSYLSTLAQDTVLDCIGPLGHPWQPPQSTLRALLIAGGVGSAPLKPLSAALQKAGVDVHLIRGAQNEAYANILNYLDGESKEANMQICTDDGSVGYHGFVTELAAKYLDNGIFDYIATCGPEPMQKIVANLAAKQGIYCEVSLARRMACGIGACLSCVVDTVHGKKRACIDGPVFDASVVKW